MSFNGSGTFVLPAGQPVVTDTAIDSAVHNTFASDLAAGLTNCVTRDGQSPPTANLPMGGFRHTGAGTATARTMLPLASQVQDDALIWGGTGGGTVDVITISTTPATTAHTTGAGFAFIASGANTGAVTLNPNSVGAKAVTKNGSTALAAGDIPSGAVVRVVYDGTRYQLLNVSFAALPTLAGTNTFAGTQNFDGAVDFDSTVDMTGAVLQGASPLVFEGATANDFETTLAITDPTADRTVTIQNASGTVAYVTDIAVAANTVTGSVVQTVNTQTGAVATGTTLIPHDDTIPQNTEGDEYMTLAITPRSATNKLKIEVVAQLASSVNGHMGLALFQDATAGALAANVNFIETANGMRQVLLTHYMTSGTTSVTTFRVRAGQNNAGTTTFNGSAGARIYGGVLASSIIISEIKV